MPVSSEQISGSVERVVFFNEETGYVVLRVKIKEKSEEVTVVGHVPAINAGEYLHASGSWEVVKDYGKQFKAEEMRSVAPSSREGIERYLGSGFIDGIGPSYAKRMVEKFGESIFTIIDEQSAKLEEVPGIGRKRRMRIKAAWNEQKVVREIMVFLHTYGVSGARAHRIYKTYGEEAMAIIRENPYQLAKDIRGIGFQSADKIAQRLGIEPTSSARVQAGLQHVLFDAAGHGDCALSETELLQKTHALLEVSEELIGNALALLIQNTEVIRDHMEGSTLIFPKYLYEAENTIASILKRLCHTSSALPPIDIPKALDWVEQRIALSEGQKQAIRKALTSRVLIITGGPGVGKTTVLRSLLQILQAKEVKIVLSAPTGRAARRMAESTGIEAKTIHRRLEFQAAGGFAFHAGRRLSGEFFVIDEISMVDTALLQKFLLALPENAHLIMVGDPDQLPSVGPGTVLQSMLDSGLLPIARLTEIFRQAAESYIITAAHTICEGKIPSFPEPKTPHADCFFIQETDNEKIIQIVCKLIQERIPSRFGLHHAQDIQVLTPMNRSGLGTISLNKVLQNTLNPSSELKFEIERYGSVFRVGDRVIQTLNNYDKDVFNGDLGHIASIETDPTLVKVRFDGDRDVEYTPAELDELQHAYAITVHKSQGSEFPAVIIPISMQHYLLLQRNLIYTALTRARQLAIFVGDSKALAFAIKNINHHKRRSGLLQRLQN